MTPKEASKLNQFLGKIKGENKTSRIYIDNLHFPYLEFSDFYTLPTSSSLDGMDFHSAEAYLKEIASFIPELIQGCNILPEARPRRDNSKIFLVKKLPKIDDQDFLWILKLESTYLGGADKSQILSTAKQGRTSSIRTKRIYFHSLAIPIEHTIEEKGEIRGFDPYEIRELLTDIASGNRQDSRIKPYSELFDEVDYSSQEKSILNIYGINSENWKPGNIYRPIGIDYLSLSFRFLETRFVDIESQWKKMGHSVWLQKDTRKEAENLLPSVQNELEILHRYLQGFDFSSDQSPSGNLRWQVFKN